MRIRKTQDGTQGEIVQLENIFNIDRYAHSILRILASVDAGAIDVPYSQDNMNGVSYSLVASIEYNDGSRLEIDLTIDSALDYPSWRSYSFHYMTAQGAAIFRYDNSHHHPDLHTAPHHKHTGADEQVSAHPQPSVKAIRAEIAAYLETA